MSHRERARKLVLDSFAANADIGVPIDDRYIFQQGMKLSPPAQDEIENAKVDLINEGILDQQYALTEKGFNLIFPSNKPAMKSKLLSHCRQNRLRSGDQVIDRAFQHNMFYFTKQEKADLESVLADLISEGFIETNLCLTENGYKKLY